MLDAGLEPASFCPARRGEAGRKEGKKRRAGGAVLPSFLFDFTHGTIRTASSWEEGNLVRRSRATGNETKGPERGRDLYSVTQGDLGHTQSSETRLCFMPGAHELFFPEIRSLLDLEPIDRSGP